MPGPWVWNDGTKRYRDEKTKKFVGYKKQLELRDEFTDEQIEETDEAAEQLADGDITLQRWLIDMMTIIKWTFIAQYMLPVGGRDKLTPADLVIISAMIVQQYERLIGFANDIAAGNLSLRQIQSRSAMYIDAASSAFERGRAEDLGVPRLPQYPGDGNTQCLSRCRCNWIIVEGEQVWECTWNLNPAEHCPDCLTNAARWNPLVLAKVG